MKRSVAILATMLVAIAGSSTAFASPADDSIKVKSNVTKKTERIVIKPRPLMTKTIMTDDRYLVRVYKSAPSQGRVIKPAVTKGGMPNLYSPASIK